MEVLLLQFSDLTVGETYGVPNNGSGKENATYIKVVHNGDTLMLESDAMEPEDARFYRDLSWVKGAIETAYKLGKLDGKLEVRKSFVAARREVVSDKKLHAIGHPSDETGLASLGGRAKGLQQAIDIVSQQRLSDWQN